jgi:hypothetical protein
VDVISTPPRHASTYKLKVNKVPHTLKTHNTQDLFDSAAERNMPSNNAKDRKRKPTKISEAVSSNDGGNPNEESKKARRVSTNASASNAASL